MASGVGRSSSVLHGLPHVPAQTQGCRLLQDLDLDTASPMSPASPATPRAMPPTMAMPTSPSGDRKRETVTRTNPVPAATWLPPHGLLLLGRRHASFLGVLG